MPAHCPRQAHGPGSESRRKPRLVPRSASPPAESPSRAQNLTPERVTKLVEDYLRDAETDDVAAQVKILRLPGRILSATVSVDEQFVTKDVTDYVKRWPERHYTLATPVSFFASGKDETDVEFTSSPSMCAAKHERPETPPRAAPETGGPCGRKATN